jgi:hypothetical protein
MSAQEILQKRDYPDNYPADVVEYISKMVYPNSQIELVGTASLRSQQYAADYDLNNIVRSSTKSKPKAIQQFVKGFQEIVRNLLRTQNLYIGDIKAGEIPEFNLVGDKYDSESVRKKLKSLMASGVVSSFEGREVEKLLVPKPSKKQLLDIRDLSRFGVLRWKPKEVLQGFKQYPGRKITLEEAFAQGGLIKLDTVAFVENNRFADFSVIYTFYAGGSPITSISKGVDTIKEDIQELLLLRNYSKVAKRLFSLARYYNKGTAIKQLNQYLNSDFGRLYSLNADAKTLLYLLENEDSIPLEKVKYEIDQFKQRLGSIYTIKGVDSKGLLKKIDKLTELPSTAQGKQQMARDVASLIMKLEGFLNATAQRDLKRMKLLPLPSWGR